MKSFSLIIGLFLLLFACTVPKTATNSPQPSQDAVGSFADRMNTMYVGLDNPVTLYASGYNADDVVATIDGGGTFAKTGTLHYIFNPDGTTREATITILVKTSSGIKELRKSSYRIRKIPPPDVLFGSRNSGIISKGEVKTVAVISARCGEAFSMEGLNFTVESFTLVIAPAKGERYFERIIGQKLTETAKTALENVKRGDIIIVCNVSVTGMKRNYSLSGVTLSVK